MGRGRCHPSPSASLKVPRIPPRKCGLFLRTSVGLIGYVADELGLPRFAPHRQVEQTSRTDKPNKQVEQTIEHESHSRVSHKSHARLTQVSHTPPVFPIRHPAPFWIVHHTPPLLTFLRAGVRVIREAAEYIGTHWPYLKRKGGVDHLWVFGHDQGAWRIRAKVAEIAINPHTPPTRPLHPPYTPP